MNTVGQTATHVSGQLSDQQRSKEFIRWPRKVMLEYLNEALLEIGTYRPEAFASRSDLLLKPGARQQSDTKGTIESVTNLDGVPAHPTDDRLFKAFAAYAVCPPANKFVNGSLQYSAKTYAVDSSDATVFYVSPAVPNGLAVTVSVGVNGLPPQYTLADWDLPIAMQSKFYNNLLDYMTARAYQRDTESQVAQAQSQRLFQLFYQTMGTKYKIDSAKNSGYYQGEVGTGDPQARIR